MGSEKHFIGVVLAAGASERMAATGTPKALLPFSGKTFLQAALDALAGQVERSLVVLGQEADRIRPSVPSGVEIVVNQNYQEGQTSSFQCAIRHIQAQGKPCDAVVLSLVDHPGVSNGLVRQLTRYFVQMDKKIVVPAFQGSRGHPVIFSSALFPDFLQLSATQGVNEVVRKYAQDLCELSTTETAILRNVNRPEEAEVN